LESKESGQDNPSNEENGTPDKFNLEGIKNSEIQRRHLANMDHIVCPSPIQIDSKGTQPFKLSKVFQTRDMTQNKSCCKFCCWSQAKPDIQTNQLEINPITMIAMNIPSYAGGCEKIWNNSKDQTPIYNKQDSTKFKIEPKQDFGDGKLEFVSFVNEWAFGVFERALHGFGNRVAQGEGPFLFTFKRDSENPVKTYYQVDGEYMEIVHPKYWKVTHCKDLPHGKVVVLCKKGSRK